MDSSQKGVRVPSKGNTLARFHGTYVSSVTIATIEAHYSSGLILEPQKEEGAILEKI
jgi:hypothetical protein